MRKITRRKAMASTTALAGTAWFPWTAEAAGPGEEGDAERTVADDGGTSAAEPPPSADRRLVSLRDFEALAVKKMAPAARAFIDGGAGDEWTIRWNEEAYQQIRLRQRALAGVSRVDTRVTLFGRQLPHPIMLCPISSHTLVHPDGETATARGAGAAEATLIVSMFADRSVEEIAKAATGPLWHATFMMKDRAWTKELLQRAESAGFEAICVPVDTPVMGARDREHRTYRPGHKPVSFGDYPVDYYRCPTTWNDIEWIRSQTRLPVVLKGIMDPDEADRAIRAGADAVFVSNHGGRNLDTVPATIDVLPEIAKKVAGRVPILIDGGIRRGTDVLKALALGATVTLIGRPYMYGLTVGRSQGVTQVINILRNELEMAMVLTGQPTISSIDPTVVWSRG